MKDFNSVRPGVKGIGLCVIGLAFILNAFCIFLGEYTLSIVIGTVVGSFLSFAEYSIRYRLVVVSQSWTKQKRNAVMIISFCLRFALVALIILLIFKFDFLHNLATLISLSFAQLSVFYIRLKTL